MKNINEIQIGSFAEACYEMNTIEELEIALLGVADLSDCKEWGLSPEEWREQIEIALNVMKDRF